MSAVLNENDIVERVLDGARISQDDARALYNLPLQELGALADFRRQTVKGDSYGGRGGKIVTYIVDRNINYTNVCNVYCKFCAFYRTEKDEDHYVLSLEQTRPKARRTDGRSAACRFSCKAGIIRSSASTIISNDARRTSGRSTRTSTSTDSVRRNSTTSREVFGMPLREVIAEVQGSRARESIPGGGGEILVDRVRDRIAPLKCKTDQWLEVMRDRARTGAELECDDDVRPRRDARRSDRASAASPRSAGRNGRLHGVHLLDLPAREHQAARRARASAANIFACRRCRRIFLDNFENVQSSWVTQGPKIGQIALKLWRERLRQRDDGGERGLQRGDDLPAECF